MNNEYYKTSDLALAAYLKTIGYMIEKEWKEVIEQIVKTLEEGG